MIKVFNEVDKVVIDVSGQIGAGWFEDGNTRETILKEIKDFETSDITVNVHSLGGDLLEGLAIYDMLKEHPARITTKIVGATASAGTIIAMAGDTVEITENSKFLIHNASTLTAGNADEHEKSAEQLRKFDNNIVSIYRKKTGKPKSEIKALMSKEVWIDASEAKGWGFIDKITKTTNKIENYKELSKILNISDMDNKIIMALLNIEDEAKIEASIQDLINAKTELTTFNEKTTAELADVTAKIEAMQAEIEVEKTSKIENAVMAAIEADKIKAVQKEIFINLLTNDFENGMKVLNSIESKVSMRDIQNSTPKAEAVVKDYDWHMKNDAAGLMKMKDENPASYQALIDAKQKTRV